MAAPLDTLTVPIAETVVAVMFPFAPAALTTTLLAAFQDTPCAPPLCAFRLRSRPALPDDRFSEPCALTAASLFATALPKAMSPPAVTLRLPVLAVTLLPAMLPPAVTTTPLPAV